MILVKLKKWRPHSKLPKIAKKGDAGADCYIDVFKEIVAGCSAQELRELEVEEYELKPLERVGCGLGFATEIPEGYYAQVVPRSGFALWKGITIANSPGTIDAGYRNEWMAIAINLSNKPVILRKGERICQFIIRKLEDVEFVDVETLESSERGLDGFASTGFK